MYEIGCSKQASRRCTHDDMGMNVDIGICTTT